MKKFAKLIFILMIAYPLIGIAVSSCADESDCSTAGRAMMNTYFYKKDGSKVVKDTLDSITVTAFYTDSVIINNIKNPHYLNIPLRYTNDTTILVFEYSKQTRDTITVLHDNTLKFVSMDCGYEVQQAIHKVAYTKQRLDSIHISYTSTNTNERENLQLFYR